MEYSIAKFSNKANPEAEFEVLKNVAIILHNCHPYPFKLPAGFGPFQSWTKREFNLLLLLLLFLSDFNLNIDFQCGGLLEIQIAPTFCHGA